MMKKSMKLITMSFSIAILLALNTAAQDVPVTSTSKQSSNTCYQMSDPGENLNRAIFRMNMAIFVTLINPPLTVYNDVTPDWIKGRISSFTHHLRLPLTLLNNILQLDIDAASKTIGRLVTNSLLGIGGLFDVADQFNIEKNSQTFSDTLAYHNVPHGSYIVLPILGPSTTRELLGTIASIFIDPMYWALKHHHGVINVNHYEYLVGFDKALAYQEFMTTFAMNGVDPYVKVRDSYAQYFASSDPKCQEAQRINYDEEN